MSMTHTLATLALALAVHAQPADDGHPALDYTPALIIAEAQAAYRAGPVADAMTVHFRTGAGRSRSSPLIVRLDASQPDAEPVFRLEFDETNVEELLISAGGGVLTAANTDNENDRWILQNAGSDIASILSHFPPLPVPQLQLAFGPRSFADPCPYTTAVAWHTAEAVPAGPLVGEAGITLRGHAAASQVEAMFDARTLRLRSFRAELDGGAVLELESKPVDAGNPADWTIPSAGRRTVAALSDLAAQRGPMSAGHFILDLSFNTSDGSAWSLHAALKALPPRAPETISPAVALVMFRLPADPVRLATSEASARMGMLIAQRAVADGVLLQTQLVAAINLGAEVGLPALRQRWGTDGARLMWGTPASSIDRFDTESSAVLVLIAPDRRLLGVLPLDAAADQTPVVEEIRRLLSAQ
jgi:hypothetical protein